jgi:hypothetical protein
VLMSDVADGRFMPPRLHAVDNVGLYGRATFGRINP